MGLFGSFHRRVSAVADLSLLYRHKTVNQAVQLLLWQIPTKLFVLLATVWMIRCLGPKNLGISAVVQGTASAAGLFIILGLDIVGPRRIATNKAKIKETIEGILGLRLRLCLVFSVLWIAAVLVLQPAPETRFAWFAGVPSMLVIGLGTTWAMQGLEELPFQGRALAISALVTVVLAAIFLRPGAAAGSDIVVNVLGLSVTHVLVWTFVRKRTGARLIAPIKWRKAATTVYDARWAFGVTVMLAIYTQLDLLLVAYLAGIEQAGFYRAAVTLTSPLVNLVGISTALLYPRLAAWHQGSPILLWDRQKRLALAGLVAGICLFAMVIVAGRPLVHLLYGARFDATVVPFIILFAAKLVTLIHGVFGWGIMAAGRDDRFLISTICAAAISLGGNFLLIPKFGIIAAASVSLAAELSILITAAYFGWREHQAFVIKDAPCVKPGGVAI